MTLPADIYSTADVRLIDRRAIEGGTSGYALMERAACAALAAARARFPDSLRWQVVCGGGNNAGDGYALARLAAGEGIAVAVLAVVEPARLTGDAATAYRDFSAVGEARPFAGVLDPEATLLVDALLGSGVARNLEGPFAEAVDALNAHPAAVLALDLPSGIDGDTGAVLGHAVRADMTVTFVGLKRGLFLGRGPEHAGELRYDGLGIPAACFEGIRPALRRLDAGDPARRLPSRRRDAHKGDFGHVLVVGGGPGMAGAARLAGEAALRAGAGRVSVAAAPESAGAIVGGCPELMCHAIREPAELGALLEQATCVAVGPGLGTAAWSRALFAAVLDAELPLVADADALNLLACAPRRRDDWILTPHPGEAARLLGCTPAAVQADRLAALAALGRRYGGTVVLKGAGTLVSAAGQPARICPYGNPGMASAGMGDVLTGVVAALRAPGLARDNAAALGVTVHALAGDRAAGAAPRGLLARDLIANLRVCVN